MADVMQALIQSLPESQKTYDFLSDAHSDEDVAEVIDAFQDSFRALRGEGRI